MSATPLLILTAWFLVGMGTLSAQEQTAPGSENAEDKTVFVDGLYHHIGPFSFNQQVEFESCDVVNNGSHYPQIVLSDPPSAKIPQQEPRLQISFWHLTSEPSEEAFLSDPPPADGHKHPEEAYLKGPEAKDSVRKMSQNGLTGKIAAVHYKDQGPGNRIRAFGYIGKGDDWLHWTIKAEETEFTNKSRLIAAMLASIKIDLDSSPTLVHHIGQLTFNQQIEFPECTVRKDGAGFNQISLLGELFINISHLTEAPDDDAFILSEPLSEGQAPIVKSALKTIAQHGLSGKVAIAKYRHAPDGDMVREFGYLGKGHSWIRWSINARQSEFDGRAKTISAMIESIR